MDQYSCVTHLSRVCLFVFSNKINFPCAIIFAYECERVSFEITEIGMKNNFTGIVYSPLIFNRAYDAQSAPN